MKNELEAFSLFAILPFSLFASDLIIFCPFALSPFPLFNDMKLIRLKAIAWKEFIQIFRDPTSLALALSIPVLLLILFGYALTLDVDRIPTVVHDLDRTPPKPGPHRPLSAFEIFSAGSAGG